MKVREMPQMIIRVTPKTKGWVISKAKEDKRSQNFIINKALELAQEIEGNAKVTSSNK